MYLYLKRANVVMVNMGEFGDRGIEQMLMSVLEKEKDPYIRQAAAFHESATEDVLLKAVADEDYTVQLYAIHNPNSTIKVLQTALFHKPAEHDPQSPQSRQVTEAAAALIASRRTDADATSGGNGIKPPQFTRKDVDFVETSQGSIYRYLPDGRVQRYKKSEEILNLNEKPQETMETIVFIPPYDMLRGAAPKEYLDNNTLGRNKDELRNIVLGYVSDKNAFIAVLDEDGKRLTTNDEMEKAHEVHLVFGKFVDGKPVRDFTIPVSRIPRLGFAPYEGGSYTNSSGELRALKHIGHDVVRIGLKSGEIIS